MFSSCFCIYLYGNIEKCTFTYWLNGRWFLQIVDTGNFNMKLNGSWFPQIVDMDSENLYPIYNIYIKTVVLASEPVGGRARVTELLVSHILDLNLKNSFIRLLPYFTCT